MSLQSITITDQLDWLPTIPSAAAPVAPGLPQGYTAYLRILPPLGIDRSIPIAEYSLAKKTVAELNARVAFWNKYWIVQGQPSPSRLTPISYREVATSMGLAYDALFSSADIARAYGAWPPNLGSSPALEKAFVQQLLQVLGPATETYFYGSAEDGNGRWGDDGFREDWLQFGLTADLPSIYESNNQSPTYIFAADRAWCFYQSELADLVVGCNISLAQALLAQPGLEALPLVAL